ncbi:MAG: DUF305 domain-containing protein [Proteobacteria bacterium]|nr:MAG: DUF305 domain-containing protein [Pseudomonadota bacterium]
MSRRHRCGVFLAAGSIIAAAILGLPQRAASEEPGAGLTASFEVRFLKSAIDHHFAALRMTELAVGTDAVRDSEISPDEGTAPTPAYPSSEAKSALEEIKSLARRNNRTQREEILMSQNMLRDWYGIDYEPRINAVNRERIALLEQASPGREFDHLFLEIFSRHHFIITVRGVECITSSDLDHDALRRMCRNIVEAQLNDVNEMRTLLCRVHGICDYVPVSGLKGRHIADVGEPGAIDHRFKRITSDEDEDGEHHFDERNRSGKGGKRIFDSH